MIENHLSSMDLIDKLTTVISLNSCFKNTKLGNQANVILLYGPPGVGKTHTVISSLKKQEIPYWIVDMKQFSEVGYQGKDLVDMYSDFWINQNYNDNNVESGVIILDEFDKIKSIKNSNQKDVSGESLQQSMLKLFDGISQLVTSSGLSRLNPDSYIDTGKITYILIGAFDYMSKYYHLTKNKWKQKMIENGYLSELVDRISYVEYLPSPTSDELIELLIRKDGLIDLINVILEKNGIDYKVSKDKKTAGEMIKSTYGENASGSYRMLISFIKNLITDIIMKQKRMTKNRNKSS